MLCRRSGCTNEIPRPTPRNAPNGYCSYQCEHKAKVDETDENSTQRPNNSDNRT